MKYFAIVKLQRKYMLSIKSVSLLCLGLRYTGNQPNRRMLSPSHKCRLLLRYFAALITYLYVHWDICYISSPASTHITNQSKYFTISKLLTKYTLFVGLIKLCCGLRYKVNPLIRRMFLPSHKLWDCFKILGSLKMNWIILFRIVYMHHT